MLHAHQLLAGVLAEVRSDGVDRAEGRQLGGGHLDLAGAVQVVHDVKRVSHGAAQRQQAVALQDHGDIIPQRALDARPFVEVKGHPFIGMVADALVKFGADLVELQQAILAGGHRHPPAAYGCGSRSGRLPGPYAPRYGW